jgi:capsular polysaccharide export protein
MILRGLSAFRNKRVLLLQGPVGPFFQRLASDLRNAGAKVFKVNFNGGDWLFYRRNAVAFREGPESWAGFFEELIQRWDIDCIMLFGDCRTYHAIASDIARRHGLEVGVFEEGYFRPNYITLEREGVNGYSPLPTNPIHYLNRVPEKAVRTDEVGNAFWHAMAWACMYYIAAHLCRPFFPHYCHHRSLTVLEGFVWMRSAWRKVFYKAVERKIQARLAGRLSKKFFLIPLQVHNDAQIRVHSGFFSIEAFIRYAVSSFSRHAADGTVLVIKHHPMDRGYTDYSALIHGLRQEFGLGDRLVYIHDQHLPTLLQHARGVVLINSTVGLSALYHGAPLKACGSAIYDMKGLTYQGDLDGFWRHTKSYKVDRKLFQRFRSAVIEKTQINGSFYKRLPIVGCFTGMRWEERWQRGDPDRRSRDRSIAAENIAKNVVTFKKTPTGAIPIQSEFLHSEKAAGHDVAVSSLSRTEVDLMQ